MSDWLQVRLVVERDQVETAESLLLEAGALSLTLLDAGDEPVHEPAPDTTPIWSQTVVQALFPGSYDSSNLLPALKAAGLSIGDDGVAIAALPEQDWERKWMDQYRPMRFGHSLWICPWHIEPDPDWPVVIRLDPGLAFGSGTHPTTALCLEWIDSQEMTSKTVLDFGCGSGVLALACALKGAARVVAVDHDPQALTATLDNARRNGVEQRITAALPDTSEAEQAIARRSDVVLANILAQPLIELAPRLAGAVAAGGRLALSGILSAQADEVDRHYRDQLDPEARLASDDWMLMIYRRSN